MLEPTLGMVFFLLFFFSAREYHLGMGAKNRKPPTSDPPIHWDYLKLLLGRWWHLQHSMDNLNHKCLASLSSSTVGIYLGIGNRFRRLDWNSFWRSLRWYMELSKKTQHRPVLAPWNPSDSKQLVVMIGPISLLLNLQYRLGRLGLVSWQ